MLLSSKASWGAAPISGKTRMRFARELGMSGRTLVRKLAADGLTFDEIVDQLRSDLAARYLEERNLAIAQIAWLVGYQGVSSFAHAFKRWTGKTPGQIRNA